MADLKETGKNMIIMGCSWMILFPIIFVIFIVVLALFI